MSTALKTKALEFIRAHQKMSYIEFKKIADFNISDCYYYMIRGEVFSKGIRTNQKSGLYITVGTFPSKNFSDVKKGILDILKAINTFQGSHFEMVEHADSQTLELRQIGTK
jgi:hypothetical protein